MADKSGIIEESLHEELSRLAHEFSFFQAMRLLALLPGNEEGEPGKVRVRPNLRLDFPAADVAGIEKGPDGYAVKATFLGLYGHASPLPTFYTEELLEQAAASAQPPGSADLLDILNERLYALFHDCMAKYRLFYQIAQQEREEYQERLLCLIGLGDEKCRKELPDARGLLRHAALLAQHPRSASGLATLLADALGVPVQIIQCVERRVAIPVSQRLLLGGTTAALGIDTLVGSELSDIAGKFRLRLGPLDRETFDTLLPGTERRSRLDLLVTLYLTEPLAWDVELICAEAPAVSLGTASGGRLGWDSWLAPGAASGQASLPL